MQSNQLVADLNLATRKEAARLVDSGVSPHLAVVLIGDNEASLTYIDVKTKRGKENGVIVSVYHVEDSAPKQEAYQLVNYLAEDPEVHGIIIQLPLPKNWSENELDELLAAIPASKDVDGLRGTWKEQAYQGTSLENLNQPLSSYLPPMVAAVCLLLDSYGITLEEKRIVLVGKGRLVGTPVQEFFEKMHLHVVSVDDETEGILGITTQADVLISGTGVDNLITHEWVKPGAIVLDCSSDVHRDSVDQVASYVSPAKGGLGPITVAWLLRNVVSAASQQYRKEGGV